MSSSHQYVLELIRSVEAKPCIWEYYSEFYHDKEYVLKSWELVTIEVGKSAERTEITVSNVKRTWKSLMRAYETCVLDGNPSNFVFFREMEFLGDNRAWYHKPQEYTDNKESVESTMIQLQIVVNIFAFILFIILVFCNALTQPPMVSRETDTITILLVIFIYAVLGLIPMYEGSYAKYHSRSSVPLVRHLVTVPVVSFISEKIFLLKLSAIQLPYLIPVICFLLGTASVCVIITTNAGYTCKKPFPPSKRSAAFDFGLAMVWTNVVCFILKSVEANSVFYVIPIWVVLNALWSYFFCYYLWMNVDSIFPNFNENPFEITPRPDTPYHIEFKQKPRKPVLEVEEKNN